MQPNTVDVKTITPEMLASLLLNILRPETEIIKQATTILKQYFKLPSSIGPLLKHMTSHTDGNVRLLASICLKKKLATHYSTFDPDTKNTIKTMLLTSYLQETIYKVKENIAYAISSLAAILVPNKEWPEIFEFIMAKCKSGVQSDIEHGALLLCALCEGLGNTIESYITPISELLTKLISVNHPPVQILAIKTINTITMENLTQAAFSKLSGLVSQMVKVAMEIQSNESLLQEVFDNLTELVDLPKFLNGQLSSLINSALTVAVNPNYNSDLRNVAIMFVQECSFSKAKILKKDKAVIMKILEASFTIAKEHQAGPEDDEETPADAILDLLEQYAFKIPNNLIYPLLMQGCEAYLKSNDPPSKKAALLILGNVSKGVEEPLKKNLEAVLNVVLQCISDPNQEVQEACIFTLCYFADNLTPDIMKYHSKILPPLLEAIKSKTEKVRSHVFYAIGTFSQDLQEKEIVVYLKSLLESLIVFLDSPKMYFYT